MYACCIRDNTSPTEWNSVVEFHFGFRGTKEIPDPSSHDWCEYIHQHSNREACIKSWDQALQGQTTHSQARCHQPARDRD